MIRLTKKLLFAIEAVLDIAYNGGDAPVRSAEITARQGIPRRYLEPVLQELVRAQHPRRHPRPERRLSPGARAAPHQPRRDRAHGARLETGDDPIERPGRQRARPPGRAAALARAAGGDDAAARRVTLEELCARAHRAGIAGEIWQQRLRFRRSERPARRERMAEARVSAAGSMTASSRRSARRRWCACAGSRPRPGSRPTSSANASSSTRSPRSRTASAWR